MKLIVLCHVNTSEENLQIVPVSENWVSYNTFLMISLQVIHLYKGSLLKVLHLWIRQKCSNTHSGFFSIQIVILPWKLWESMKRLLRQWNMALGVWISLLAKVVPLFCRGSDEKPRKKSSDLMTLIRFH